MKRVKIVEVHEDDAFHRDNLVGLIGKFDFQTDWKDGWYAGELHPDRRVKEYKNAPDSVKEIVGDRGSIYFYGVKVEEIPRRRV